MRDLATILASLRTYAPLLEADSFSATSDADPTYNCAAWAVGDHSGNWWPEPDAEDEYFWPAGALRDGSLEAILDGYGRLGFAECENAELEPGFSKIAIFATRLGSPQHVSRQLPDGRWASKMGELEDIEHQALRDVSQGRYGQATHYMKIASPQQIAGRFARWRDASLAAQSPTRGDD